MILNFQGPSENYTQWAENVFSHVEETLATENATTQGAHQVPQGYENDAFGSLVNETEDSLFWAQGNPWRRFLNANLSDPVARTQAVTQAPYQPTRPTNEAKWESTWEPLDVRDILIF